MANFLGVCTHTHRNTNTYMRPDSSAVLDLCSFCFKICFSKAFGYISDKKYGLILLDVMDIPFLYFILQSSNCCNKNFPNVYGNILQVTEGTFMEEPGSGAVATIENKRVSVGTLDWIKR